MTLTVHHLGISQSERVVFLCEELGIDYELKKYDRSPLFAPPEYKALHPLGAAPVIQDGDVTLAESGACVDYILQTRGEGRFTIAPGEKNHSEYLFWFHFANGTLQPNLMRNMTLKLAGLGTDNENLKRHLERQKEIFNFIDKRLSKVPFLAGDQFTAADIMNFCCLTTMRCYMPIDLSPYPNILAYLKRIAARDGYRRAMRKGDADLNIEQLIGAPPPPAQKGLAAILQARRR
ncbi:glutathione S-transferase [Hypoxylon sp. NC1633]|nr:glutathione S-transferase [Hypoxylon sp. NC1633]